MSVSLKNESYVKFRDFVYLCYCGVKKDKISKVIGVSETTLTSWGKLPIFGFMISMLMVNGLSDSVRIGLEERAGLENFDFEERLDEIFEKKSNEESPF